MFIIKLNNIKTRFRMNSADNTLIKLIVFLKISNVKYISSFEAG